MNEKKAAFFDLDGTLVNLNPDPKSLERLRYEILRSASTAGMSLNTKSIMDAYQQVVAVRGFDDSLPKRLRQSLDAYEVMWAESGCVAKFGVQRLEELKRRGFMLAIVTSNGRACLQKVFDRNILNPDWFEFAITRDESPALKPSPVPLELAWRTAQQRAPNLYKIWFIGDSMRDQRCAESFNSQAEAKIEFVKLGSWWGVTEHPNYAHLEVLLLELLTKE